MWYTIFSWGAVLSVAIILTGTYKPNWLNRFYQLFHGTPNVQPAQPTTTRKQVKKPKHKLEDGKTVPASGNEAPSKKRKIISPPINDTVKAVTVRGQETELPRDNDDDMSNKEFAQELAKAQAGTKLERRQDIQTVKSMKNTLKPSGAQSPSLSASTSGQDGDDDSSTGTPQIGTPSTGQTSRAGHIDDMLEPAAAKPQTMRITGVPEQKQKQAPKQFEQALTKKQRQRQAKAEENKRMREDSDKQHEAKKQQHLRTARMAEGSSNQTKSDTFAKATQPNVWQKKEEAQAPQIQNQTEVQQPLLDTFEQENPSGQVSAAPLGDRTNGAKPNTTNAGQAETLHAPEREGRPELPRKKTWAEEVEEGGVDETAQDEWAKKLTEDSEENWDTVTSKKSKKKGKKDESGSEASAPIPATQRAPATKTNGVKKENVIKAQSRPQAANRFASMQDVNGDGDTWEA